MNPTMAAALMNSRGCLFLIVCCGIESPNRCLQQLSDAQAVRLFQVDFCAHQLPEYQSTDRAERAWSQSTLIPLVNFLAHGSF